MFWRKAKTEKSNTKEKVSAGRSGKVRRHFFCSGGLAAVMFLTALLLWGTGNVCLAAGKQAEESRVREELDLYAVSAVLLDGESGRVLYGKREEDPMANASTTKVLTCITVLENCKVEEELTVSEYAASMPKVKLFLKKGEKYAVEDLLYSMMLESHNDSAAALAEYVGRKCVPELAEKQPSEFTSEESLTAMKAFSEMMNRKAREIGCADTYFITPNGLDAEETILLTDGSREKKEHHTTARDLAQILSYCVLRSPEKERFLQITGRQEYSFAANGRNFFCVNHNALLGSMDGIISGKTGFTGKAGYCYVGMLKKDGRYFAAAVLACGWPSNRTYKWKDMRKLFEYGTKHFHRVNLFGEEIRYPEAKLPQIPVTGAQCREIGETGSVELTLPGRGQQPEEAGILLGENEKIRTVVSLKKTVAAPVKKGQKLGEIRYIAGEEIYYTEEVTAAEDIAEITFLWCLKKVLEKYLGAVSFSEIGKLLCGIP